MIHLVIAHTNGLHGKHHTRMTMNKFHFNEHKQDTRKCDWLVGHIISITNQVSIDPESCYLTQEVPSSYHEASKESVWRHAKQEELDSIKRNETWEMVTSPLRRKRSLR